MLEKATSTAAHAKPAVMTGFCRDCLQVIYNGPPKTRTCAQCGSPRIALHPELATLSIAHLDCDAFYASVEKRDDPSLLDKPVIIGGGRRGVVSAACYVARTYGIHSAMPMFKALKACPHAVVIGPDMEKYNLVGREVRALMLATTPLVEPLSIDEAFLDLNGTERLHKAPPSVTVARLVQQVESQIGINISVGLSYNKFLAKVASDRDKPRGYSVIGLTDADEFLRNQAVNIIWGVGKKLHGTLVKDGYRTIADLRQAEEKHLMQRYGVMGRRLYRFSRGVDDRAVDPISATKSVSCETTFETDVRDHTAMTTVLWRLSERLSGRLKSKGLAGRSVTLKLKTADFRTVTRRVTLGDPTQLAEVLFRAGDGLLKREIDGRAFRLLGIGTADLGGPEGADPVDLADPDQAKRKRIERAMDAVRAKMGDNAITKGRGFKVPGDKDDVG